MLLGITHQRLGWPSREEVLDPSGAGPAMYARLVRSKLGQALLRRGDVPGVEVGILAGNPKASATEPPLAVVCEFSAIASDAAIEETHRLAWNFCRAPLLITLEPHLIRAWTSCEQPREQLDGRLPESEIPSLRIDPRQPIDFSQIAARSLSWVSLASGGLFREYGNRFPRQRCADETLLDNLKAVRSQLIQQGLSIATAHDLLARLMFVQFLFHRKDDQGQAALTPGWLHRQHKAKRLSTAHRDLESVLRNYDDAYALFRLLNERFNGDLFPGKAADPLEREQQWRREMAEVQPKHLDLLADFVGGKLQIRSSQRSLWPLYLFDVIPLEFISSVYEAFVSKDKGTHYTPAYLVDVVLDTCLPWDSDEWDVKILDPACGSGIFLVKAFQRLVYRWCKAHKFRARPGADLLRKLLTENLFGVDVQKEAVRVACFSLYLAMCDGLEPRYIWDRVKFPLLRGSRLIAADFFQEDRPGFRTLPERESYDVVVGNAPWGAGTMTSHARKWAKHHNWEASYNNIGPLFLAKGVRLAKPDGYVSMLQPSGLLLNTVGTAATFRERLLEKHRVEQIINLSALRFGLFRAAVGPACVFCMKPAPPEGSPITYVSPKPSQATDDSFRIVFDSCDYHAVRLKEAAADPGVWTTLMWGGRRDYELVRRLTAHYPSIEKLEAKRLVRSRTGIIRGRNPTKRRNEIVGCRLLDADDFPPQGFPYLDASSLPENDNPLIHEKDSTDWTAFDPPQLLIKLAYRRSTNRFQARIVRPESNTGALCSTSYVSVHFTPDATGLMEAACLTYNSKLAMYYLLHTSYKVATSWQEPNADELLRIPLPTESVTLDEVTSPADADDQLRKAFKLKPAEWMLIQDALTYTMEAVSGPRRVKRGEGASHTNMKTVKSAMLAQYGEAFARVLHAGFGQDKRIRVTVYDAPEATHSPVQLVAIHLGWPGNDAGIQFESIQAAELLQRITELTHAMERRSSDDTTVRRRVFQMYDTVTCGKAKIPTVYLCKPNLARYWTRSMAMRDADVVSADLVRFAAAGSRPRRAANA